MKTSSGSCSRISISLNSSAESAETSSFALPEYRKDAPVQVSIRPEEFVISHEGEGIRAKIDDSVFLGLNTHYFVTTSEGVKAEIVQESQIDSILPKGMDVNLTVKKEKINVLTEDGSRNILEGVQNDVTEG